MKKGSAKPVHCAIYTRVSTDQGLEQDFNSLHAQYDASQAYIRSQAHAGWTLLRAKYEDRGFSGGNTDRPALQRLLDDVRAGKVDVIVVYKVDRLTRSLADFAKLVEQFDKHNVSFVSVTQQFNTRISGYRIGEGQSGDIWQGMAGEAGRQGKGMGSATDFPTGAAAAKRLEHLHPSLEALGRWCFRGAQLGIVECVTMDENQSDTAEQVVKFTPKERPRSYDTPAEEAGQAIIAKIQKAADLANENCDRAMALAHKLAMQLKAAEDRINQLEAEVQLFRERADRSEAWLQTIHKEIEERLIAPRSASGIEQKLMR